MKSTVRAKRVNRFHLDFTPAELKVIAQLFQEIAESEPRNLEQECAFAKRVLRIMKYGLTASEMKALEEEQSCRPV